MTSIDRKEIRRLEKAAEAEARERIEVVIALMSHTKGRKYLWGQLVAGHLFTNTFSENHAMMAFQAGQRNQILELFDDIVTHAPEEFILLMREKHERDTAEQQPRGQDGDGGTQGGAPADGDEGRWGGND